MRVAVLGAGSWGTALSLVLARNGHEVRLLGRDSDDMAAMGRMRENLTYLPGFRLPEEIQVGELGQFDETVDLCVVATPSSAVRSVLQKCPPQPLATLASKGLDASSRSVLSHALRAEWPNCTVSVLSGPNLALELARGIPTVAVVASKDQPAAEKVRGAFMNHTFRVYLCEDVEGVELAGALKNVLAIGAGMSDGLGFGDNTKGALLARGLNEVALLGLALGAKLETFLGIAGVGDLFATATSKLSRNYRLGVALGKGDRLEAALHEIGQVAEGVPTCEVAVHLGREKGVALPICEAIHSVIHGIETPIRAVELLMERTPRHEGGFVGV